VFLQIPWFGLMLFSLLALGVAASPTGADAQQAESKGNPAMVKEIVYKKTPQGELKLLISNPADWQPTDKRPAILFFFGGGWAKGSPEQFRLQAEHFAKRGMVALRADYRVKERHKTRPVDAVEDAKSAMRYIRANAATLGIDANRIVGAGGSAGGHLAVCTALIGIHEAKDADTTVSSVPNALVLFNPVMSLEPGSPIVGPEPVSPEAQAVRASISPVRHIGKSDPPMILFFGTDDKHLPPAREYFTKATKAGNRCQLYLADKQPHSFFNRSPWRQATLKQADAFLVQIGYLRGEGHVDVPEGTVVQEEKP
jgi:acetyl esterase